jgi:hypothetical protein
LFPDSYLKIGVILQAKEKLMVGVRGLEPPASCSQSRRASQLRHTPSRIQYKSHCPFCQRLIQSRDKNEEGASVEFEQ